MTFFPLLYPMPGIQEAYNKYLINGWTNEWMNDTLGKSLETTLL